MKIKNSLFPFLYLLLAFCLSLHAQAPDSLVGQTITYNYQGKHDSGSVSFQFLSDDGGWMYDEHGGWDQMSYEWISSSNPQFLKILFSEGDVLDANLTFFDPTQGNSSFLYLEPDENENLVVDDRGTATFSISNTLQSKSPPIGRFFEDDFSDVAITSSNFGFGDGDSEEGLTVVQNTSQGEYSLRGVFTDNDAEDSDDPDRWVEISAKTLLPMNRSWIVEAELFSDEFDYNGLQQIDYMRTAIEIDGSLANFHIGTSFNGQEFRHHAGIWNEVAQKYDSATKWIDPNAVSTTYRLVNNADDYELLFQVIETFDSGVSTYTTEFTLIHLEWDDGWYFKNDYNYPEGKYLDNWESIGDRYVQPELAFELPHSWSNGHGSELTMYDLQGGEIGFRRFSVQGDPEIIEFDDGDDVPAFYNNLLNEVGQGGSSSRYHLLKGLHELAQLVESTESDSLKQFAVSFGVEDSILDFSLADSPLAGTYEFELDREFHIGKLTAFAQNSLIPRLESIDNHFAQVTDVVTMETSMTGAEEEIIADATDVKVLRAMVNMLASLASLQSGYDWDLNAGYLQDLDMEVTETDLEEFREKHPGFLGVRSVEQLKKAQTFLQTAISVYKEASSGLRSSGRYATQADWLNNTEPDFLFVLDEYDFAEESEFIADLEELYDALSNDYEITDDEEYSGTIISLNAFFNGGLDLPKLLPESAEDQFVSGDLNDPTLGGILPGMSYDSGLFVQDLREAFYDEELVYGGEPKHEFVEKIFVSGGSFDYPHYSFQDSQGSQLDMENFIFQPDTTYRFVDDGISQSHPFTLGASIRDSGIIKLWKTPSLDPNDLDTIILEEHVFTGASEDFSILSTNLLMPPIEEDHNLEDFILNSNGDYFDFEYSEGDKEILAENDVKIYYICDNHASMNGQLYLSVPEEEIEQFPVFLITPDIFQEITFNQWEWTPVAREEGAYFALRTIEEPAGFDLVNFSELILVNEVILQDPQGQAKQSIWVPDVDRTIYQTNFPISPSYLMDSYGLSIKGYYQPPKVEDLMAIVEGFLEDFRNGDQGNLIDNWVTIYHAEKFSDMLDPDRCIYTAELSNDVTILFNQNGDFVHSTPTFWDNEYKNDYIPEELEITVEAELPGSRILELWEEISHLDGTGFVYRAVVESKSSEFYEIYLNNYADKIHLVTRFYGEIERVFPESARAYMAENYRWEDGYEMYYSWWFDEPTGNYYAQLDDGRMVIFDQDGDFKEEVGLTVAEVKLSFNADKSSWGQNLRESNFNGLSTNGQNPAYINIKKLKPEEFSPSRRTGLIADHDMNEIYSSSTVIISNGVTYLSLQDVPAGTPITSSLYWTQLEATSPTENPGEPPANDPDSDDINGINPPEDGGQNQAPQISDSTFEVTENSPIGTLIGQVIASDPDGAVSLYYSLHSGVESLSLVDMNQDGYLDLLIEQPEGVFSTIYNESGTFQTIEQLYPQSNTGGEVSVNNLFRIDPEGSIFTNQEIDFEELGSQVSLGVTVSDEEGAASFKKLTVNILDEDDGGIQPPIILPPTILPPPPVGSFEGDIFQISFTNSMVSEDADIGFSDLELGNTDLPAGTPLKLTFNYEEGDAPQYIIVSGANVRGFKHIYPEWDPFLGERPGSFTILADTVDPVISTDGDLNSTFGMIVVMGGERYYQGAIFEANVPVLELGPAEISDPWSSAAFSLAGKLGEDTKVRAFLPRNLLEGMGLPEFHRLKAGLAYENGEIQFINGSFQNNEINGTGTGFYRLLHQGEEIFLDPDSYGQVGTIDIGTHSDDQFIEPASVIDDFTKFSKFDFNGDGLSDDLLEVGFQAEAFPAEVQFGDFYIEETVEYAGEISGKIVDAETGIGLSDFGIWPFTAPYGINGPRESNFEYDLQQELWNASGEFSVKLPAGEYYLETWGYDVNSSDYYPTKVISNNGGPFVIPEDGNVSFDNLVVELEKEIQIEYVWVSSKLVIEGQQGFDQINGVEIQLYLVDDNDVRISDYPNAWLWVEPDGSIYGEAPVGKSEVVLQSWDNSVKLLNPPFYWEVSNDDEQTLPYLYAAQAGRINVSGKIRDAATQVGIWAEVVFVDPNDENNIFWPQWEPMDEPFMDGDSQEIFIFDGRYSVSIPAGTYKIKATMWDGIYQSEYYISQGVGTTDFAQAESIDVDQDLTDIDFNLDSAPTAQINISVLEQETNASIPYAWFDFYDGYDEYGPVMFPQVDYSNSEDGNYTVKSSAGSYKILIGSPDHDSVYLRTDIQGNYYWEQGWDWSSAALLEFANTDVLDLPIAKLKSFGPPPPPSGGNSISGKVVTNRGEEVPKAYVFAHTDDWLYWYETTSKGNGNFSFDGLPEGNWIVYADPPYDSEEFSSYRSSSPNWESPISLTGSTDEGDVKLVLQGSNIFGRILYPKKNENGTTKLEPLANAFIWAFQDENQTGEPNYDDYVEGEIFTYNEAYGETNEDGYFSFYLPKAGKYSMRVELPWFMTSQEFAPIHFDLRNTDQELVLGNTIRLDWKKAKIDTTTETFSIERKSDTENNYKSLDSNKSKSLKSYLDTTVKPGKSYEYRVYEVASNGGKDQLSSSDLKVSKPFIYLAPSEKIIKGEVKDQSDAPAGGAEIVAWQQDGDGWANTFSDNSGKYELVVGPGKWEVMVYPPWDISVDWNYNGAPKLVNFANNSSKVEKTANFTVERLSSSRGVIGQINIPEGKENLLSSIYIDVFKTDGYGNWANPQSDGNFSVSLEPGRYELSVWLDPIDFAGYVAPEPQWVRVGKGLTDVGVIEIVEEKINSGISGTVSTAGDETKTLANFEVWAWSENGDFIYTSTDVNGSFELKLNPGRYEVGIEAPLPPDGSQSPYLAVPSKKVKVVADSMRVLNFQVTKAAIDVEGVVNNSKGSPVLDSGAWVYAFSQSGDDYEFLAEMPVSSRGTFSFPGIPGTYSVGLWLPPGSDYIHPNEQEINVENGNDNPDKIIFTLEKANALISGKLINKETNSSIEDLVGEVYAMRMDGDGWRTTEIESNGTYSLILSPGKWMLDFYIEYDAQDRKYPRGAASPIEVLVSNGLIAEQNFILNSASASITGKVIFADSNASVTDYVTYIWAYRKGDSINSEYWQEVETDENGTFVLPVLKGGLYEIGASISPDLLIGGYLNPPNQFIKMDANSKTTSFSLAKPPVENFISGSVIDDQNQSLSNAYVYAWNYDGVEVSSYTNSEGDFNMSVSNGTIWYIGAEYSEFDGNDNEVIYLPAVEATADLQNQQYISDIIVVLEKPNFVVPDGISVTFDPTKDFVTTLPDGTEITIPAGAVNVPSGQSMVRLVVSPSAKGLDKSGNAKPADYAYKLELFDEKGKEIEGVFKKDIIIKVDVDVESFVKKGIDLNTIEGMYYSTTKQKWEKVKTSTWDPEAQKLTMTTDHFTGITSTGQTAKTQLSMESTPLGENSGWFDSTWFGEFYDPLLSGTTDNLKWIYSGNKQLEWIAVSTKQSDDSYWFYHSSLEWIWISKEFFDIDEYKKSHIYIFSENLKGWVFLDPDKGIWDFNANNGVGAWLD